MIALDLFQLHYQNLLIIYLKFTAKNVDIKTANLNVSLKDLEITNFLIISISVENQLKAINWLIKKFPNTYKFCNNDISAFILSLRREVYRYEYMNIWERFDEASLREKKTFHSNLYIKDTKNVGYTHAERIWEYFKIKKSRWISWSICSKWYIIACRCIWGF